MLVSFGGGGTREAGGTIYRGKPGNAPQHAHVLCGTRYWAGQAPDSAVRGRREARPTTSHGSTERLCARMVGASQGGSEGKPDLRPRSVFSYESQQEAANWQDFWDVFQGCAGLWTVGCWLAR